MEIIKTAEPFFRRRYFFNNLEEYEEDFRRIEQVTTDLGVQPVTYFNGVFAYRISEQVTKYKPRPRHLHSDWAIQKFKDWVEIGRTSIPIEMESVFVKRSKKIFNPSDCEGTLVPNILEKIRARELAITYLCVNPKFKEMYAELPPDIKEEYFGDIDVYYIESYTRINQQLMDVINEHS